MSTLPKITDSDIIPAPKMKPPREKFVKVWVLPPREKELETLYFTSEEDAMAVQGGDDGPYWYPTDRWAINCNGELFLLAYLDDDPPTPIELDPSPIAALRRQALAKLTDAEIKALGIEEGGGREL